MCHALLLLEGATNATRLGAPAGPDLTRYFAVLIVLVLAILGLAVGFKKLFARTLRTRAAQRQLAIVDLLPLGGKQRLAIVRCYDRTFALGLGDKEVALISEIDPVNTEGRGEVAPPRAERAGFAQLLSRARPIAPQGAPRSAARAASAEAPRDQHASEAAPPVAAITVGRRVRDLLGSALGREGTLA
jgi:flagellar biogenesis protein FliO